MGHKGPDHQDTTVTGAFELPSAFVPLGLSALLGLAVMALLEKWGGAPGGTQTASPEHAIRKPAEVAVRPIPRPRSESR